MVSILFLEDRWEKGGLNVSPKLISFINLLTYAFILIALFVSPLLVPEYIPYKKFIRLFILILIFCLFSLPLTRDILTEKDTLLYYVLIFII